MPAIKGFPRNEAESKACKHGHRFWFGNECGECDDDDVAEAIR